MFCVFLYLCSVHFGSKTKIGNNIEEVTRRSESQWAMFFEMSLKKILFVSAAVRNKKVANFAKLFRAKK